MDVVTIDYETYYDKEYSLRRMSEISYVLDHRFQTILCAVKVNAEPSGVFVGHDAVKRRLDQFDWSRTALCAHNMRFDGAIAAWHYDIHPFLYLDTLGMARALIHAVSGGSSLAKVSTYLGLIEKGSAVHNAIGMRLEEMQRSGFLIEYMAYCMRDNDNCWEILQRFLKVMPRSEILLIDTVLRMFLEPQVRLNPNVLAQHLATVQAQRAAIMGRVAHIDKSVFSSSQQFAKLLEEHGVEVPTKTSPTTGSEIYALAKNDRAFKELCEDDEQPLEVQALLAARLNAKSTLEETRTSTLLNLSLREWEGKGQGWAPVPIKYYGAHTGRVSGDGGFNWLNFKRGSPIRAAVEAPVGWRVVHRDASQIEARMVAYLARCKRLLDAFADPSRDPYCEFATSVYGEGVTKADKPRRFVGKTSILGLGYQTGYEKLRHTLFIGNGGVSVVVDLEEAKRIVYKYRGEYHQIPKLWSKCADAIEYMLALALPCGGVKGRGNSLLLSAPALPIVEVGLGGIWLPNGMCIQYPNLRTERRTMPDGSSTTEIVYSDPYGGSKKLYGGKLTENISQALTRIIVTDIAERVRRATDYLPFLHTYDSLDYVIPLEDVAAFDALLEREFAIAPAWAVGLPLASEGGFGVTLLDAEKGLNI